MINYVTVNSIIKILRDNHIRCGIGGSFLLQVYHLFDNPNDVDFWVAPEDMQKVKIIFNQYQEIEEKIQLPPKYHFKVRYIDIDVDFVACFITKPNKNEYIYNILPESIETIDTDNIKNLPCTSLEDWYIVYKLLRREEKAAAIRQYICKENVNETNQKLRKLVSYEGNKLPKRVTNDIENLIWDNMQINFLHKLGNMNNE